MFIFNKNKNATLKIEQKHCKALKIKNIFKNF